MFYLPMLLENFWTEWGNHVLISSVVPVVTVVIVKVLGWIKSLFVEDNLNEKDSSTENLTIKYLSEIEETAKRCIYQKTFIPEDLRQTRGLMIRYAGMWLPRSILTSSTDEFKPTEELLTLELLNHVRESQYLIKSRGYKAAKRIREKESWPPLSSYYNRDFFTWYITWLVLFLGVNAIYNLSVRLFGG